MLNIERDVFLPSIVLLELDLAMKNRDFDPKERTRIFELLGPLIPEGKILPLNTSILSRAASFDETARWSSHYFDVLVASFAVEHSAEIITTDTNISKLGVRVSW